MSAGERKEEEEPTQPMLMPDEIREQLTKVEITERIHNGINYSVITDAWLQGGSKTRGLQFFYDLKNAGIEELSFAAFSEGYGQVIVSYGCKMTQMKCKIFINKQMIKGQHRMTEETKMAMEMGATIIEKGNSYTKMADLNKAALRYVEECNDPKVKYVHIGLFEDLYIQRFTENLIEVRKKYNLNPSELWVASGVGVIANCISRAFPGVMINVVQSALPLWKENRESIAKTSGGNYKIWIYKDTNPSNKDAKIPYKAHKVVDSKIWSVAHKNMKEGALIWNVA